MKPPKDTPHIVMNVQHAAQSYAVAVLASHIADTNYGDPFNRVGQAWNELTPVSQEDCVHEATAYVRDLWEKAHG